MFMKEIITNAFKKKYHTEQIKHIIVLRVNKTITLIILIILNIFYKRTMIDIITFSFLSQGRVGFLYQKAMNYARM